MKLLVAGELGTDGTCAVGDDYQGVAMTLIDSMSTLAVLGNASEFQKQAHWLTHHVSAFPAPDQIGFNVLGATIEGLHIRLVECCPSIGALF